MILLENQTGVFRKSASPLRHWGEKEVNTCGGFAQTADGLTHPQFVLMAARFGHIDSIDLIAEVANGDLLIEPDRAEDKKLAQAMLKDLEDNYPHALQMYIDAKGHAA
jgi:putative chitinase